MGAGNLPHTAGVEIGNQVSDGAVTNEQDSDCGGVCAGDSNIQLLRPAIRIYDRRRGLLDVQLIKKDGIHRLLDIPCPGGVVVTTPGFRRGGEDRIGGVFHIGPQANHMDDSSGLLSC